MVALSSQELLILPPAKFRAKSHLQVTSHAETITVQCNYTCSQHLVFVRRKVRQPCESNAPLSTYPYSAVRDMTYTLGSEKMGSESGALAYFAFCSGM